MTIYNSAIHIESMDTKNLSEDDFMKLNEITQDMWADGIGEFVQCTECGHMHSKKDIFGNLKPEIYNLTVKKLMGDFEVDNIQCQDCGGKTRFVYGKGNLEVIKDRLTKTRKAFLVIGWGENNEIAGYEDAYIDTLESIFNREYETHYRYIGIPEIRSRIDQILGYSPIEFINLSDIGLLHRYRTFKNIFGILKKFSQIIPDEYTNLPGFTELDERNSLHKISSALGGISLGLTRDTQLNHKISNIGQGYKSDLLVCHGLAAIYKKHFSGTAKTLVSLMNNKTRNIPV